MDNIKVLASKVKTTIQRDGVGSVAKKSVMYLRTERQRRILEKSIGKSFKDVLFINGVNYNDLPHPPRYRVKHQIEQLLLNNVECDEIFYTNIDMDLVRMYRVFIVYRCWITPELKAFIEKAHSLNKIVLYDIDDLVIDTKYTDLIKYLDTFSPQDRANYDESVRNYGRALKLCDGAITTTERLAEELKNYVPQVFVNRNTASLKMIEFSEKAYLEQSKKEKTNIVKLGYFSGSITHNDDFNMIKESVLKVMKEHSNVELHIVGLLDIPEEFEEVKDRIVAHPFTKWQELPALIASIDINLAPLTDTIFNEAKSENKWVEAALVRVVTIASNLGAFKKMIKSDVTGVLCDTPEDWYNKLTELVTDTEKRESIALDAYNYCIKNCVTLYTGYGLKEFIESVQTPNLMMVLPALNISGGIMVAFEHCKTLKNAGYDITIVNDDFDDSKWITFAGVEFPVIASRKFKFRGKIDKAVATMWSTVSFLEKNVNIKDRYYLVQNFETDFYEFGDSLKEKANCSYSPRVDVKFLTISKWCEDWLESRFNKKSMYLPNGLHTEVYTSHKRSMDGKIRILVEGDNKVYYKNVDESFKITNELDHDKFEVWYLSYNGTPKDWYIVDKFYNKVPFEEVSNIYKQCDILVKTSILESFSYPPLEMMSTGGYVVAVQNGGNSEYLKHGYNCLFYPQGNIEEGKNAILRICEDKKLRDELFKNGLQTAQERDWNVLEDSIKKFYEFK